jgi:hypothetical protein
MNNINDIFDPFEDPEDTIENESLPLRRDRIRSIIANIMNRRTHIKIVVPPIERQVPGVTYIVGGEGTSHGRTHWLASSLVYNKILRYAIFRDKFRNYDDTWSCVGDENLAWYKLFPTARRVGGIALVGDDAGSFDECDTLQLLQFDDDESLQRFKLTTEYVPMHNVIPVPYTKTEFIFEDTDKARIRGWLNKFKNSDFTKDEVLGIMSNYTNYRTMETIFLGDIRTLNNAYRLIGGSIYFAWMSHRLAKSYKERTL